MTQSEVKSINGREISDNYSRSQLLNKIDKSKINDDGTGKDELWSANKISSQIKDIEQQSTNLDYYKKDKLYDKKLSNAIKENELNRSKFYRLFNKSSYKDIKMNVSRVDYRYDFRNIENGNLYNYSFETKNENNVDAEYLFSNNSLKITNNNELNSYHKFRFNAGRFKPFVNYEIEISDFISSDDYNNRVGFFFDFDNSNSQFILLSYNKGSNKLLIQEESFINGVSNGIQTLKTINFTKKISLIVQYFCDRFEIYTSKNGIIEYQTTKIRSDLTSFYTNIGIMNSSCGVLGFLKGGGSSFTINKTEAYLDCGIGQADIRPIKYEDGCPILENGKMYFTLSARTQNNSYQTVVRWTIDTNEFDMVGIILFTYDGVKIYNDVASCLVYDRINSEWIIWNTAHNCGHISARTKLNTDVRFGYNIIKTELVETEMYDSSSGKYIVSNDDSFYGKSGDEDVDIIYDKEKNKWYLILCRLNWSDLDNTDMYRYQLYESDNSVSDFVFVDRTTTGNVTGGSIIKFGGEYNLVCGSNNHKISQYNFYKLNDLSSFYGNALLDIVDGGYRGWGAVIPLPSGNFTRYILATFDRVKKGEGQWTYGNLYFYELNHNNINYEYDLTYNI